MSPDVEMPESIDTFAPFVCDWMASVLIFFCHYCTITLCLDNNIPIFIYNFKGIFIIIIFD